MDSKFPSLPESDSFDPYRVLGVPQDASRDLIKASYRKLAIACHPDKFTDLNVKKAKEEVFKALTHGYDVLINDERRKQYDRSRHPSNVWKGDHVEKGYGTDASRGRGGSKKDRGRPNGMLATQGFIQGQQVNAMPDTGAGYNIIAASLAHSLGFAKPPANAATGLELRLAHGKCIWTVGVIEAVWSFSSNTGETWRLPFHIIEDFVYDAVLGNDFLMATETMSKHQFRLSRIPPPMKALSVLYVNTLGSVNQRLRGILDDSVVDTLPDSGCESNLLALDYIQERDWNDRINTQEIRLLLFADGTVQKTRGTLKLPWRFLTTGSSGDMLLTSMEQQPIVVEFHIMYGCVYDVILGHDTLEETQAFSEHQDAFSHTSQSKNAYPQQSELNLVIWLPFRRSGKKRGRDDDSEPTPTRDVSAVSLSTELQRRAAADHAILRMKIGRARSDAVAEEKEIRTQFESARLREDPLRSSNNTEASVGRESSATAGTMLGGPPLPLISIREPLPPTTPRFVNVDGMNLDPNGGGLSLSLGASVYPSRE